MLSLFILTVAATLVQLEQIVSVRAADCYWREWPYCGLLIGCINNDHFMYYGWKWYCPMSPAIYCCPAVRPLHDIILCEHENLGGDCISHYVESNACVTLDKNDWASSVNPLGGCFRLYEHDKCEGKSRAFYPNAAGLNNLANIDMNDMVSSVSRCSEGDSCPPRYQFISAAGRRRRSSGDYNCRWFRDTIELGFLVWLSRDRTHLTGPVLYYQRGPNNRAEVMEALIRTEHLDTGSNTNQAARDFAHSMGTWNDDAGHILANRLGGSGTDLRNIFPQSPHFNRGVWSQIEAWVADVVRTYGSARFTVNLEYDDRSSTRPSRIFYRIQRGDNDQVVHVDDLLNP